MKDVEYRTRLTIEECRKRITNAADKDELFLLFKNIYGREIGYKLNGNKISLRKIRPFKRNSFRIAFIGNFSTSYNKDTLIKGKYEMNKFGLIFLAIWELIAVVIDIGIVIGLLTKKFIPASEGAEFWSGITIPFLFPFFGIGMYLFSKRIAESDQEAIEQFIKNTCLAE